MMPMMLHLREWKDDVIHTLLRNSTNKQTPANLSSNSLQFNLWRITCVDFKEEGQDNMEGLRAGRRIIGQVAGHKINLEIEGVQDKKK